MIGIRRRWRDARATWPVWARALTVGWIVWPVGLIGTLVLSLIVYSALTTPPPPQPKVGGPFGALPSSQSPAPLSSGGSSSSPSPSVSASATGAAPAPNGSGVSTPKTVDHGVVVPLAGRYTVRVDATEVAKFSGIGLCNRTFPTTSTILVKDQYTDRSGPTSYEFDIDYSTQHQERHIYRYTKDGVFLDYEFAQVRCGPRAQSTELTYSTPQRKVFLPLRVGATWSGQGGDAERTETFSSKVLRTETLTIAGRSVATYVIETSVQMTGSEHGTRLQRWWYSPTLALPVKTYEAYDAASGPGSYRARVTVTFADLDPR